jgi:hypothetical protein
VGIAVILGIGAFFAELSDGLGAACVNSVLFFGMGVLGVIGVLVIWAIANERPPQSYREARDREIEALMGYTATDDDAWRQFWGDEG